MSLKIVSDSARHVERPAPAQARRLPLWMEEVTHGLAIRTHFVMSGNLRDLYPAVLPASQNFVPFAEALWQLLRARGFRALLVYDPVEGLRLHDGCDPGLEQTLARQGIRADGSARDTGALRQSLQALDRGGQFPIALMIDHASHLRGDTDALFLSAARTGQAVPVQAGPLTPLPQRNPVFWMTDRAEDLPDWFRVGNDALAEIRVDRPDLEERFAFAQHLWPEAGEMPATAFRALHEEVALACDGDTLVAMRAIATLARSEKKDLTALPDVLRSYRTGSRRNPWATPVLRSRMDRAREHLTARIKGQDAAVDKTLDILMRSVAGLSGAQSRRRHAQPRGVLFFAGPTGVGKTELAKSVTDLLFADEAACHRFDMSEFMEESAVTRLLGAPPGHPGHDRGGELIKAVQARPFSVLLFDEIEKAHPRVLDVFLQILDEGRLTDARGMVAHFSETLIIFTSNIGMFGGDHAQNMGMSVMPSDPYPDVARKITAAVQEHFRFKVQRPELMNRIGQNVVVFDFIDHRAAHVIFDTILRRVQTTIAKENGVRLHLSDQALADLRDLCTHDVFDGGRGIGNRVETHFINPAARLLLAHDGARDVQIDRLVECEGRTRLVPG